MRAGRRSHKTFVLQNAPHARAVAWLGATTHFARQMTAGKIVVATIHDLGSILCRC
jgi:hypothetical protein